VRRNYLNFVWRAPAILLWLVLMPLLFFIFKFLRISVYQELPHYFHRGLQFIFGLQVVFSGEASKVKSTLYVSNHVSYLDVFVLGGIRAFFIAKSEVENWPILGFLARFQNTLFFERTSGEARHQIDLMQAYLQQGKSLILFPEGTSTEGTHVKRFKSSLFEAANIQASYGSVAIQPITVAYTHYADQPMDAITRDHYAWYGKMPFGSHFRSLFSLKKACVQVHYHPVCYLQQFESRKQCAEHCQNLVAQRLIYLLS